MFNEVTITAFRQQSGPLFTDVVQRHRPQVIRRGRDDRGLLVGLDEAWAMVADRGFSPQVLRGDEGVSIWLPEFELYGDGATYADAKADLLDEVLAYVREYLANADEYRRAPNRAGHFPHVVKALGSAASWRRPFSRARPTSRRSARPQPPCERVPVPDKKDVKRFCELDGWEETEPHSPDHHQNRKRLNDGTVLRTKVSHGRGAVCHAPALWANIWRHQLGLNSEDELWEVLKSREPVQRAEPEAPPREPQMPTWLFEALVYTWGMDEEEVRGMSEDRALARYITFCEGGPRQ